MTKGIKTVTGALAALVLTSAAGAAIAQSTLFDEARSHATPAMQAEFPDLF